MGHAIIIAAIALVNAALWALLFVAGARSAGIAMSAGWLMGAVVIILAGSAAVLCLLCGGECHAGVMRAANDNARPSPPPEFDGAPT